MTPYLTAPTHVAACNLGPATVIVNYNSGRVHTLIGPSARWWTELAATSDPSTPTGLDPRSQARLRDQLRQAEVLIDTATPTPWAAPINGQSWTLSFGTQEARAGRTDLPRVPRRTLLIAGLALVLTLAAQHCGRRRASMARLLCLLRWATRRAVREATTDDATQVTYAVRRAGLLSTLKYQGLGRA